MSHLLYGLPSKPFPSVYRPKFCLIAFVPCPAAASFFSVASGLRDGLKRRAITAAQENIKYARRGEGSRRDNCCVKIIK